MQIEKISFVIPCYGSEHTIEAVVEEIKETMGRRPGLAFEVIAVNDQSPDEVQMVLEKLAAGDRRIKVITLAKNSGKANAQMAAFRHLKGDVVVCLDDDGQCPMGQLWDLLAPIEKGSADSAVARYPKKKESAFKRFGSKVNARTDEWLLGKPQELQISNFSAHRRFVIDEAVRSETAYPYFWGLVLRSTSHVVNVEMEERERLAGRGHFNFRRSFAMWLDGFTACSIKPLRLADILGLLCAAGGFGFGIYAIIRKLVDPARIDAGYSSIIASIFFVGGVLMILLGLVGEYVGRIYMGINKVPQYVIRESWNLEEEYEREE
ncbi:glycosyltransferase [Allofournierella sp.]|uniref:glycosyltransferase n=1 Tax=Allofournierella sp. TaxID=1940256 RepID=UPI003AB83862